MLILSVLAAVTAADDARTEAPPARTIVLFGASWCAPCRVELRQLPALAAMVAPDRIAVAWLDRTPGALGTSGVRIIAPQEARGLFQQLASGNQGVPVTAMLDATGRFCAHLPEALRAEGLARLRAQCGR